MVTVQTFTFLEYQKYMTKLPAKLIRTIPQITIEMANFLKRRITMRSPHGRSGSLKRDIRVTQGKGKGRLKIIGPGHWKYVNAGVAPNKMIPIEAIEMHLSNPGMTAGKKLGTYIKNPRGWFMANYTGGKGFVDRALITFNKDIRLIMERGINKALQK